MDESAIVLAFFVWTGIVGFVSYKIIMFMKNKVKRLNAESRAVYRFTAINKTKIFFILLTSAVVLLNYEITHPATQNFVLSEILAFFTMIGVFILPFGGYYWHVRNHSSPDIARRATILMIPISIAAIFAIISIIALFFIYANQRRSYYD